MTKQEATKKCKLMKHKIEQDYKLKKLKLDNHFNFCKIQYNKACTDLKDQKNKEIHDLDTNYKTFLIQNGHSVKSKKKAIPKAIKEQSWNHWMGPLVGETLCPICEQCKIRPLAFDAGHIKPECQGGEIEYMNLIPICHQCNLYMGSKNMYEYLKQIGKQTITLKGQIHSIEKLYQLIK